MNIFKSTFIKPTVKKYLLLPVLAVFVILGTIGGCSDGDGGGGNVETGRSLHGVLLGQHRDEALDDLLSALDLSEHDGTPHHIHLDGMFLHNLTEEERELIREAFEAGFIISIHDVTQGAVELFYSEVLQHGKIHAENPDLDVEPGEFYHVWNIEQHNGIIWTSIGILGETDLLESGIFDDPIIISDPNLEQGSHAVHGLHKREWIEDQPERRQELIADGLLSGTASQVAENFDMMEEFEAITRDQDGTILSLATAYIQTNQFHVSFTDSASIVGNNSPGVTEINTYQLTTKAWVATEDTPSGLSSFLFINQDMNLASRNGFISNSDTQQAWYLSRFKNINTLQIGSSYLNSSQAQLLDNEPETNQATTSSETTSVSASLTGTVGVDQSSGANASVSGGISWETSNTFSKADVSINNLSLSQNAPNGAFLSNDASWEYLPRKAEILDDSCNNSIHNLADLSHNTFTPSQAYIYRINGSHADQTVKLNTQIITQLTNTYINNCNLFGCACDASNQTASPGAGQVTYTQSIHIPAAPDA